MEHEKDAAKILEKALKNYSPMKLITTKMIGDRPEIVEKNENTTTLKIKWEAVWNQEEFSRTVVPPLVDILEKIKLSEKEASAIKSGRGDFGTLDFSIWTKDCGSFDFSIWQKKRLKYYIIDKNIVDRIPLNYYDSCVPGRLRFILLLLDNNDNLISYLGNNDKPISYIELLYYETYQSPFECWIIPGFFVKKTEKFTNRLINEKVFSIPTQLLPKIASIRILVGNQIGHEKIDQTNSEYHPDEGSICFATFKPYTENKFKGNCFLKCIGKDHSTHRSIYELYEASDDIMKELKREKFSGESFGEFFYPLGGEFEFLPWKKE